MSIGKDTRFVSITGDKLSAEKEARLLTGDEIEDILSVLSEAPGGTEEVRALGLFYQRESIREKLKTLPIGGEAIKLVKEEIRREYDMAKVLPHKPVGIRCAEAFIATVMQATLNTRHKAGAGIDVGFDAVREVIFMPQHRKVEMTMCHFLERKTREEILDMRAEIVYRNVGHFIDRYEIDDRDALKDYWWSDFQRKIVGLDDVSTKRPIMRLFLNISMMIEYRLSMQELAAAILTRSDDAHNLVRFVYGPLSDGIFDIYPMEGALSKMLTTYPIVADDDTESDEVMLLYEYYLDQHIRRALSTKQTIVRGYEDIEALYFASKPIISAILSHERLPDGENGEVRFYIKKRRSVYFFDGITNQEVHDFITSMGGEVEYDSDVAENEYDYDYDNIERVPDVLSADDRGFIIVNFPKGTVGNNIEEIYKNVQNEQLKELREKHEEWLKNKEKWELENPEEPFLEEEPEIVADIDNYSEHNYAILYTSNLSRVLSLSGVDRSRTYCNNFHEMTRTLGSEAARAYHLYNTYQVMNATKSSINPRYLEFFSNVVFQRGTPTGITFTGISKQTGGWLSRAAIEQSVKVLVEAACFDKQGESTRNAASAVCVGNMPNTGSGATPGKKTMSRYRLPVDEEDDDDPDKLLQNLEDVDFDPSAIIKEVREKKRISQITDDDGYYDIAEGEGNMQYENIYGNAHNISKHLDVRVEKFEKKDGEGPSLRKLHRIIDRRDYVRDDTEETPSIIGPDQIEEFVIEKFQTPNYIREIFGIGIRLRNMAKAPKIQPKPQNPNVNAIDISGFMSFVSANLKNID